jgi:PilZ domain
MATDVVMPQPGYARMRRWPRYRINVPVRVVVQRPDKTVIVSGRGTELNEGGMCIFAGVELKLGQRVAIEFTPPYNGQPMRVRSTIRNRSGYNYGSEFLLLNREDKLQAEQIRQVLQAMGSPADEDD